MESKVQDHEISNLKEDSRDIILEVMLVSLWKSLADFFSHDML